MSMEYLPKFQIAVPPNMGTHQLSSKNKRKLWTEKLPKTQSINFVIQVSSTTKNKTAHVEPSLRFQHESFESVRSKLRESLAAALISVSSGESKTQEASSAEESGTNGKLIANSQVGEPSSTTGDAFIDEHAGDSTKPWNSSRKFEMKHMPSEDTSFNNLKDEFLQGNRLCWASDINVENSEFSHGNDPKRSKFVRNEVTIDVNEGVDRAQNLALNIETELFRLFGGVNKKYKEKGRSLLFNLKDPSNPELRERVFSGEITPERLCLMTAEELASKQLTEWRIAKAEELAQMVVLPDSDVDLRRLVKKTHKGEFQVEVEQDDSFSVEVTLGANAPIQVLTRTNEGKDSLGSTHNGAQNLSSPSKTGGELCEEAVAEDEHHSNLNTHPQYMPGGPESVVDEQDVKCLPPIVSFDEFRESHDSVSPFKNFSIDTEQHTCTGGKKLDRTFSKVESLVSLETKLIRSDNDNFASKLGHSSDGLVCTVDSVDVGSADPLAMSVYQPGEVDSRHEDKNSGRDLGFGVVPHELDKTSLKIASGGEHIWEGLVQLNISSLATLLAFFKSGEKASTSEWPGFLEVKGRVRIDAFEKFLQELPMSRSRAIMVVHFLQKEGSYESGRASLTEAVDSYIADNRLGYAEPVPGVELYLCPPRMKAIQMLGTFVQEGEQAEASEGLIGVVVWRRPHVTSTLSPRLSSHQKHTISSKSHSFLKKQQRPNAHLSLQSSMPAHVLEPNKAHIEEDVGDVPPGFGPGAATRHEADLPEFDFPVDVGTSVARPHGGTIARPATHVRELIQKYGHGREAGGTAASRMQPPIQPWDDDDDDDDIPEWQPHRDNQPGLTTAQWQQSVRPHLAYQHYIPVPPQHATTNRVSISAHQLTHLQASSPLAMSSQTSAMRGSQNLPHGARWPGAVARVGRAPNGAVERPCHYGGGRLVEGQCYGRDPQIVVDWGHVPRSRSSGG